MTICKKMKRTKNIFSFQKNNFKNEYTELTSLENYFKILLTLLPILREIWKRIFAKLQKFLQHHEKAAFKPSHFVKC